jgi:geranyl-CoA carboxylase beta subunit
VPQITVMCGASFGAGNYGMCGRGFEPRFLLFLAQRAHRGDGRRAGRHDHAHRGRGRCQAQGQAGRGALDRRTRPSSTPSTASMSAITTSSLMLDDGVIDPRDTRAVLALCLTCADEAARAACGPDAVRSGAAMTEGRPDGHCATLSHPS